MGDVPAIAASVMELITAEAERLGFAMVRVRWFAGEEPTLQIMAERPETGQLTIDDCSALSHAISDHFDAMEAAGNDPFDITYRLEVSSPGIDRPLTRAGDFAQWAGHEAKVTLADGAADASGALRKNLMGRIIASDGAYIDFAERKGGTMRFAFTDVADAKLLLTDALIAASRPIDTSGADEFETDAISQED
ncbi:MAG: ribosome maturation factor [Sphingomonadaceae bacterium]|nr:ribosome maturation factor [Sphingomonadaceae bacterium]